MRIRTTSSVASARPMRQRDAHRGNGDALERSKEALVKDFRTFIDDGEALLKSTSNLSGEALVQARTRLAASLADARVHLDDASRVARQKGRQVATATDRYVHAKPWPVVGLAAGVGFA